MDVRTAMEWYRSGALALGEAERKALEADEDLGRRALEIRDAFGGMQGEAALQTILAATLFRSPVDHRLPRDEREAYGIFRDGQNSVAVTILFYLDHASQLERKTSDGHRNDRSPGVGRYDGPDDLLRSGPGSDDDGGPILG